MTVNFFWLYPARGANLFNRIKLDKKFELEEVHEWPITFKTIERIKEKSLPDRYDYVSLLLMDIETRKIHAYIDFSYGPRLMSTRRSIKDCDSIAATVQYPITKESFKQTYLNAIREFVREKQETIDILNERIAMTNESCFNTDDT